MRRGVGLLAGVMVLALLATGCDVSTYAFKVDESIDIVEPKARAEIDLPVSIRWTDSRAPGTRRVAPQDPTAEYYAVFVDRAALAPGRRLSSLVDRRERCQPRQGCPTAEQLADLRTYLDAGQSLVLDFITDRRASSRGDSKDVHEVTLVRMRGDRRIGETAFLQTFFVRR